MISISPLRYPGGKRILAPFMGQIIKDNALEGCTYVEPYAGGAAVALDLLFRGTVSDIIINDYDRALYAFWCSVVQYPEALCSWIEKVPLTIDEWKRQKVIHRDKASASILDLGKATLYLNRTNRSGVLRGGVIGGLSQEGKWKMDARFNRTELARKIRKIAALGSRISVRSDDAVELLQDLNLRQGRYFVYLDPPYFVKGSNLYQNFYKPEDHERLRAIIEECDHLHWLTTYDDVPEIKKLWRPYYQEEFCLNYSAGRSDVGKEVMIFGPSVRSNLPVYI